MKYIIKINDEPEDLEFLKEMTKRLRDFQYNDDQFMFIVGDCDIIEIKPLEDSVEINPHDTINSIRKKNNIKPTQ